jgi:hypothetical protein
MYGTNNQVIIDALVDQIKKLKLDLIIKESENEQLKKELSNKEK